MRRAPALLLLVALLGGLGASSLHGAAHGTEWAEAQRAHAEAHPDGEHATTPCADDLHALDCAVCAGVSVATASGPSAPAPAAQEPRAPDGAEAGADRRQARTPARGPPAVA